MDTPSPARARTAEEYKQLANDMVAAFDSHDEAALLRLNAPYQRTFTFDDLWAEMWRRVSIVQTTGVQRRRETVASTC